MLISKRDLAEAGRRWLPQRRAALPASPSERSTASPAVVLTPGARLAAPVTHIADRLPQRPLLEVDDLHIRYENPKTGELTVAVGGVSLSIRAGEFVSIVGLSGCGKSSLLSAVAGLLPHSAGAISIDGQRIDGPGPERSVVFQKATLLPWRTVIDNITYGLELRGMNRKEARLRAAGVIDLVQLRGFERFYPSALSGGMQQRVNLARALVTEPRLLLLDEPFAALDAITRETMQNELLSIWEKTRKAVLMVTHQIDEAVLLSDRVIVLTKRPARVAAEIVVDLPRPRTPRIRQSARFEQLTQRIWESIDDKQQTAEVAHVR